MSKTFYTFTVSQLIEVLKDFPQDSPVVVSGYEGGYENIQQPLLSRLQHLPQNPYWDGEFQQVESDVKESFDAVVLNREVRHD